jgi:outer membrane protein OmpA-like peptidoglycan-associated protein
MKKIISIIVLFLSIIQVQSQSYLGYFNDNYSGVHSVIYNPANIADSRFKTDINLFSSSILAGNDYYGFNALDILKDNYDFEKQAKRFPTNNNNLHINLDIMGPAFMFNLTPKSTIAIFTRGRSISNVNNIDGDLFNQLRDDFNTNNNFSTSNQNFNITANAWAEAGLSYARVIFNKEKHFLKGGLSLKYLQGLGNSYANANNLGLIFTNVGNNSLTNTISTSGVITYGEDPNIANGGNYKFLSGSYGLGADLGFTYEFRPNYSDYSIDDKDKNKYKLRLGLSVTDFGSILYKGGLESAYKLSGSVTEAQYNNSSTGDFLDATYLKSTKSIRKVSLPTAIHLNADWNIHNKFYLNVNGDFGVTSKTAINTNSIENLVTLTPRFEVKWFSAYLPISYLEYSGPQAGFGFRAGPLFVGSGSIISNLISDESKGADLHLGLKIPIYQGRKRDQDLDGIVDKKDNCPEVAGPIENNGCPWPDSDKDGVLDKDDKCPKIAGDKANKGCPWEDTDKDGVFDKDDKCPKVAGEFANNGCPWEDTDKDSVLDKDDKCPTVFGIVANNGCPEEIKKAEPIVEPVKVEVAAEVIKKINDFSKTILFDTGKTTIKEESFVSLDGIVSVLTEYQNANFKIEGHTDSSGKPASNLKLSKGRAAAVKQYLIDKGIRPDRLTSEGYGSKKPIASNKTAKGKILNRRVEVNLVK